ncbi:MAG: matrixin family metalloprotease [Gemmatimonadales bacterium]|nr:MAG: matrixin family metalloprotease [Gemmatimonadales bacterium]
MRRSLFLRLLLVTGGLAQLNGCKADAPAADHEAASADSARHPPPQLVVGPELCLDAGYLCAGLAEREDPRVLRWSPQTGQVHVYIPRPPLESRSQAIALQDAAARGILAWNNKPLSIRIHRGEDLSEPDIVLRWAEGLGGTELGRAETVWNRSADGSVSIRVQDFVLALRDPTDPGRILDREAIQLAAAHEMGHVLGLPHSDSERDVMYPTNSASALSARDYRTLSALYDLPNGAVLSPEVLESLR